jgi:hypothetical protein
MHKPHSFPLELKRIASPHFVLHPDTSSLIHAYQPRETTGRGYRNTQTFISMIYLIAAPLGQLLKST